MTTAQELLSQFRDRYATGAALYRAPGRVNLIGEHTDYNDGFVMPAAIGFSCCVAIAPRDDRKLVVHSASFEDTAEASLDALPERGAHHWSDYPLGVAAILEKQGYRLPGANVYIASDVPLGVGLSSSAAIDVSVGYALLDTAGQPIDRTRLALLCQRVENEFVGAHVGIMDPFVSCHGRAGHAIVVDCRSLEFRAEPLPAQVQLVICNTMVKHQHAAGEYNTRRAECETGVRLLSAVLPGITALRDVTFAQLERHRGLLPEVIYRRCRHIITENDRVQQTAAALEHGQLAELPGLLAASHRSMRDDYEISCPELDAMVELAAPLPGVYGARMTGGGFGGCTINLVAAEHASEFQRVVGSKYAALTGLQPDIYVCEAADGAGPVSAASPVTGQAGGRSSAPAS